MLGFELFEIQDLRREAESLMVDACTVTRGGGGRVLDEATGTYVITAGALLYDGRCRVRPVDNTDRVVQSAGDAVSLFRYRLSVPVGAEAFEVDDKVTVTSAAADSAIVGLVLRVRQAQLGSTVTARRLECEVDGG